MTTKEFVEEIIKILLELDAKKLGCVYQFVLHLWRPQ